MTSKIESCLQFIFISIQSVSRYIWPLPCPLFLSNGPKVINYHTIIKVYYNYLSIYNIYFHKTKQVTTYEIHGYFKFMSTKNVFTVVLKHEKYQLKEIQKLKALNSTKNCIYSRKSTAFNVSVVTALTFTIQIFSWLNYLQLV